MIQSRFVDNNLIHRGVFSADSLRSRGGRRDSVAPARFCPRTISPSAFASRRYFRKITQGKQTGILQFAPNRLREALAPPSDRELSCAQVQRSTVFILLWTARRSAPGGRPLPVPELPTLERQPGIVSGAFRPGRPSQPADRSDLRCLSQESRLPRMVGVAGRLGRAPALGRSGSSSYRLRRGLVGASRPPMVLAPCLISVTEISVWHVLTQRMR